MQKQLKINTWEHVKYYKNECSILFNVFRMLSNWFSNASTFETHPKCIWKALKKHNRPTNIHYIFPSLAIDTYVVVAQRFDSAWAEHFLEYTCIHIQRNAHGSCNRSDSGSWSPDSGSSQDPASRIFGSDFWNYIMQVPPKASKTRFSRKCKNHWK